jgi:hypothetical protein
MGRIEELADKYSRHVSLPWQQGIAASQRVIMLVYEKELERTLRERKGLFEEGTIGAGHTWREVDLTAAFARWLGADEYAESYFEYPEDLALRLDAEFPGVVADEVRATLRDCDRNTVVGLFGVGSLFGLARFSAVLKKIETDITGRLLVFYPGQFENNKYHLLDATEGFNYMAVPILLQGGEE